MILVKQEHQETGRLISILSFQSEETTHSLLVLNEHPPLIEVSIEENKRQSI